MAISTSLRSVLAALMQPWRKRAGGKAMPPECCSAKEVHRGASDPGLSVVRARRPDRPDLLPRRMDGLRLDPDELAAAEPALVRELQRLCAKCKAPERCARDLMDKSTDAAWQEWQDYCPNANTLGMLSLVKSLSKTPQSDESLWVPKF